MHSGARKDAGSASDAGNVSPEGMRNGNVATYSAGLFAVCAGAINSAVLLLASANDKHPTRLGSRSNQVGRNFMYHQADALLALSTKRNEDSYTKTWGTNDFYFKDSDPAYRQLTISDDKPTSAGGGSPRRQV